MTPHPRRPTPLVEVRFVQILALDVLAPQVVDQLTDAFSSLDSPMAEHAIAVPKISCPSRAGRTVLHESPAALSYSSFQQQLAQQNVDIPVLGARAGGGLEGSPPSSPPDRGFSNFSPGQKKSEAAGQVSARVHGHSSSSELSAQGGGGGDAAGVAELGCRGDRAVAALAGAEEEEVEEEEEEEEKASQIFFFMRCPHSETQTFSYEPQFWPLVGVYMLREEYYCGSAGG